MYELTPLGVFFHAVMGDVDALSDFVNSSKACLVYDHEAEQYTFIDEFEDLNNPTFVNGYFVTESMPMDVPVTIEKYSVVGTELSHVGRLFIYENDMQTLYSEQRQENGVWVTEKERVTEADIDLIEWDKPTESKQ